MELLYTMLCWRLKLVNILRILPFTLTRILGLTGPKYNNCDPIITSLREFVMNKIISLEHLKEPFPYIVHHGNISDL